MHIQRSSLQQNLRTYQANQPSQSVSSQEPMEAPQDTFSFSEGGGLPDSVKLFGGMGLMVAGGMYGAQIGQPAIMAGAIFGGLALMLS